MPRCIVVGAGVGGLSAAAVLARAGYDVVVLEAQVYPGGCAATFFHQGYRFDSGATMAAGFYPGGPMDQLAQAVGIPHWNGLPAELAMTVHQPGGEELKLWSDDRRWSARQAAFGSQSEAFWVWQERTADALWDLALRSPIWPLQNVGDGLQLLRQALPWIKVDPFYRLSPNFLIDAILPVATHLKGAPDRLRQFVDAQLLISAQATSKQTNALYGAAALDIARRGVMHLEGGMGSIAEALVQSIHKSGGQVHYRQQVTRILLKSGKPISVETRRGEKFPLDVLILNLPPPNIYRLMEEHSLPQNKSRYQIPQDGWGAFIIYVGFDSMILPDESSLHHQVIAGEPLGEGNSIFISANPGWDSSRAPAGQRAATISTHTDLRRWWHYYHNDRVAYDQQKTLLADKILQTAEIALPGLRQASKLVMPGTPVTFQRFTRREYGWVGGFPQTHLFRTHAPRLAPQLWMVGDSIFPGQSTAATALGGMRVARQIIDQDGRKSYHFSKWQTKLHARSPQFEP